MLFRAFFLIQKIKNMVYTIGLENNVKNIYQACYPFIGNNSVESLADLKTPYLKLLKNRQPECPVNYTDSIFILDKEIEEKLKDSYSTGSLNDLKQSSLIGNAYSNHEKIMKMRKVAVALSILSELDATLFAIFINTIHSIFIRGYNKLNGKSEIHGGSSSGAIGVIWLTVSDKVTEYDLVELFIHELTHHLIFIDELNKPQFVYSEIKKKENYAYSSILNMNRPLDKVIHSIIVATELVLTRQRLLNFDYHKSVHPETDIMIENVQRAYDSVKSIKNLKLILKPRGIELMEICLSHLNQTA